MKPTLFTLFLLLNLLLISTEALAQPKHSLAIRETWYNYRSPLNAPDLKITDVFSKTGNGFELAYYNRLFKNTFLAVPLKIGTSTFPKDAFDLSNRKVFGDLDLLLQHDFFKYGNLINPYISAGVGSFYNFDATDSQFGLNFPVAIGVNIRIVDNIYLSAQTQHRFSTNDLDGWHHGLGVHIFFHGDDTPPPPPPVLDRDGDGIADASDRCPDQPGPAALQGCPDADGDGVPDLDDSCPTEKGLAAFGGCPDTDGDGIPDNKDRCPREAGPKATEGCPDRDNDGIVDSEDACPDQPGPKATQGCPDRDGDGIVDRDDLCPDKRGPAAGKGCPDTDGDGVYDNEDRCIEKPGPASNKGCPELKAEDKATLANVIKNVQFATGSATLLAKSFPVLDEVANLMAKYPEYHLTISGHTDNVGDDKFNQSLSEKRAKACYDYLNTKKGIAANRMSHAGYGESRPVADNKTKAGRDKNRRVDFDLKVQ